MVLKGCEIIYEHLTFHHEFILKATKLISSLRSVGTYMWWNCCMADLAEIGGSGSKMAQNLFSYAPKGFLVKYNEHEESFRQ